MKKNVYAFLIEKHLYINTFTYWTRLKTAKFLATAKQLNRKIRQFFSQSKRTDRFDPLPQFGFVRFLNQSMCASI